MLNERVFPEDDRCAGSRLQCAVFACGVFTVCNCSLFGVRFACSVLLWLILGQPVHAATLLAVVSERNAGDMVQAAQMFKASHPQTRLVFRTTTQIDALTDAQLRTLLNDADAILLATVFRDTAQRIMPMLDSVRARQVIALACEPALGRLSRWNGRRLFTMDDPRYEAVSSLKTERDASAAAVAAASKQYPQLASWIRARGYWQNRSEDNLRSLFAMLLADSDAALKTSVAPVRDAPPLRLRYRDRVLTPEQLTVDGDRAVMAILDDQHADGVTAGDASRPICESLAKRQIDCLVLYAGWGEPTFDALQLVRSRVGKRLGGIVAMQDFVIGGSSHRVRATQLLEQLDVPVFKALRLHDTTAIAWRSTGQGLAWDSVYYRLAMPELQGSSQPIVVATAAAARIDATTGIAVTQLDALPGQIDTLAARAANWIKLQARRNADKQIAIVYYNHPPGRHNIGADNLDVPASLFDILQRLQRDGYDTGPLPNSAAALLDMLQRDGVNLPEQGDALHDMAGRVTSVDQALYARWFATAPQAVQQEMIDGPLGLLRANVGQAIAAQLPVQAREQVQHAIHELEHLVEGARHPARARVLDLLHQLEEAYEGLIGGGNDQQVVKLTRAITGSGIEGLRGWGPAPGKVMVDHDRLVLPGLRFGKIFVGPQPPRGWELNEELLHANLSVPPTHQYLAFYYWLRHSFQADAIVHLGRHSTYEFLPRKSVGLDEQDYPTLIAADIPGIYPYIVDGVGEGLQAKRRGMAVMIDHLIPPLSATPLYDNLLRLRQLVESFEATNNPPLREQAAAAIRELIDELNLRDALTASMDEELKTRGISFQQADDEMLVHEIGHYLTRLQEDFMPLGLHVFGRPWSQEALNTMQASMQRDGVHLTAPVRKALSDSPRREMNALLHALAGHFVAAGPGNDPIRNADALPTGRNFHGLDNSLIPSRLGYSLGEQLAVKARTKAGEGKEAVILWASDSVRDEGAMVGFGLALLGVQPQWNSRGVISGVERRPLDEVGVRADTLFVSSGLFRDLFGQQIAWLDKAVLLALDGSRRSIEATHPQLKPALAAALEPLGTLAQPGSEPLQNNHVAQHWIDETLALIKGGATAQDAGAQASLRVFGTAQGDYGAGINRLVERSGAWTERSELAKVYMDRIGFGYRADGSSAPRHDLLRANLGEVRNTYLGRSSNLYGLIDNNDAFDYLGGLSLAVESVSGKVPASYVADHSNPQKPEMQALPAALVAELRGRYLNPAWIKPLMQHGYAGARTMGSEFVEYLWGWQVTNPDIIKSWAWDEVKAVYLDDKYQLDLDKFLEDGANVHVKTNMQAILLVAAQKQFWDADAKTLQQLSQDWVDLLLKHGLPGSGHTQPDHPVFQFVQPLLRDDQREPLQKLLAHARQNQAQVQDGPSTLSELQPGELQPGELQPGEPQPAEHAAEASQNRAAQQLAGSPTFWVIAGLVLALIYAGFARGRRQWLPSRS